MLRRIVAALVVTMALPLASGTFASRARGDEDAQEREVPDYDGRGEDPTSAGDTLVWIPRVLFFPLYLVSEFVLRRPIGWLISTAEEEDIAEKLAGIFTFGPEGRIAVVPTALIDFGFKPSVGLYFRYNDFLAGGNKLRLHGATWGPDWLSGTIADRFGPEDELWQVAWRAEATRRPDGLFYGVNEPAASDVQARYQYTWLETALALRSRFWRASTAEAFARLRSVHFGGDVCCDDANVPDHVAAGVFPALPPGYERGYFVYQHGLEAQLDTRRPRPAPGTGLYARAMVGQSWSFDGDTRWWTYGGSLGGYLDLSGFGHVVSLIASAAVADPIEGEVPFTELVSISGSGPMRGFIGQRILGDSAASLLFEYHWPIWVWLDGTAHVAIGDAFPGHLDGFALDKLRMSFGLGIAAISDIDHIFELSIALGTERFDQGTEIDSVRFVAGATRGF